MSVFLILLVAGGYLYLLFAVAFYVDSRSRQAGRATASAAWVYALSIAVYCTSWTFYGSVGRSAATGIGFLPIYIGPALVFVFGQPLLRKIVQIAKTQHITTIADFISARYGKSQKLAGLVTVIAVVGIMPYISLQLKAVSHSFDIIRRYPAVAPPAGLDAAPAMQLDTALYVALLMSLFVVVFGTRRVDATEQHRGMVTAVALESLVKLAAFLAVGLFVTYAMFDGFGDLFARAAADPKLAPLLDFGATASSVDFWALTALSMAAIVCLPRQFQVTVVENQHVDHIGKAGWIFPLYLAAINLFVLPIALAGLIAFPGVGVDADAFVLGLPIAAQSPALALFAFIGGLSAATAMLIVETIALSTMICNDLAMPLLIRGALVRTDGGADLVGLVKLIRRASIVFVLLLGYAYVRLIGESYALVSIGLVSFAAAAQFAPAMIGGIYWKAGTRAGALTGLGAGFAVWAYTLLLPSLARSGWLPEEFAAAGPLQVAALRPYALFGLAGLDPITHSLVWSMIANIGGYVAVSLRTRQDPIEAGQAQAFVDVFAARPAVPPRTWQADVRVGDLMALVERFVDRERAGRVCAEYALARRMTLEPAQRVDVDFVNFVERLLAGAIGTALARVVVASRIGEREMSLEGVMAMLSSASQAIEVNLEMAREAIENIAQGVAVFDADLRLVLWNRRLLELLDLPPELAAVGTPFAAIVRHNAARGEYGPGDIESQVAERVALAQKREPHLFERERPNGQAIEVFGKPLPSGGFVSTFTDITERKRTERELERRVEERTRELRQSEERFRDLAETASDWFWEMDAELRFTYLSERFFELSGIRPAEMLGKPRWGMASAEQTARDPEKWRRHREELEAHRPVRNFEYEIRSADGRLTIVRVSGRPRFGEGGDFLGYRGTGANITELVRTQAELLRSEKLAALGGLVAGVAHEINTPVGIGLTAASHLEEQTREFDKRYAAGNVRRSDLEAFIRTAAEVSSSLTTNLRRAAELVRGFKQVAVDQSSEQRRRFNLKEYLDEILRSLHPRIKRTSHTIHVVCPDDIELDSYPGAFSQIVTNLVLNSLIHGFERKENGRIDIEASVAGDSLLLHYSDDGCGMAREQAKRLFEPFFTTKRGQGGSGLGMHVVYNLVTQTLGGQIECSTAPDRGVSFHIRIPFGGEIAHERPTA